MQNQTFRSTRFISGPRFRKGLALPSPTIRSVRVFTAGALFLVTMACTSPAQQWPTYSKLDSSFTAHDSTIAALHFDLRKDSSKLDTWIQLFELHKQHGEVEKELQVAAAMASSNPYVPRAHHALGDAQLDNGMMEEALKSLHKALALEPKYVRALTTLAEAYDLLYLRDTALLYLDSAIHCNPRSVQAHFQKAELLSRMGRRVEAIESYRSWANLQPHIAEPWVKLGEAQSLVGDYADAIETLKYALLLNANQPDALFQLAVAKQGLGQTVEAREAFRDFFYQFPRHAKAQEAEELARALGWKPGEN